MNSNKNQKLKMADTIMPWLQIILGCLFIAMAVYKYIANGYDFHAINLPLTIIFGLVLPLIAIAKLVVAKKKMLK